MEGADDESDPLAAEEADDADLELILPSGPAAPPRRSSRWAPGLAASSLLGPRALRSTARVPRVQAGMQLRRLVEAGDRGEADWHRGPATAGAAITLLTVGLLVVLLHLPSRGGGETAGLLPKRTTQLTMECMKVACVGASITRGNVVVLGGELASDEPYPVQLGRILGPGYCVENFGVPGSTVLKHSRRPFWEQPEMQEVVDFLPDIVVIQFGANDSRENNFEKDFRHDYASIIAFFRGLPSHPKVYIMAMPPIYPGTASKDGIPGKKYGMDAARLDNLRVPLDLIAKENGLSPPITVLNAFKKHCPEMHSKCDWMSGDGVHPNHDGDAAMARLVHLTIAGDNYCTVDSQKKEQCGDPSNTTEAPCKELGCCYTPDSEASAWCFKPKEARRATVEECMAGHDEKTDCGFEGESMEQCLDRGCCYKPSLDGTPWCFHRLQLSHPDLHFAAGDFAEEVTSTKWSTPPLGSSSMNARATTGSPGEPDSVISSTTTSTSWQQVVAVADKEALRGPGTQAPAWPVWLVVASFSAISAAALLLVLRQWQPLKEEKQQVDGKGPPQAEILQHKVEEDQQRELRRLQEHSVTRAARSAEQRQQEKERLRRNGEILELQARYGFTGVNDRIPKRPGPPALPACLPAGFFRTSYSCPLHVAVEANQPEVVRLLLHARADHNLVDSRRRTPLDLAESLNKKDSHEECLEVLRNAAWVA